MAVFESIETEKIVLKILVIAAITVIGFIIIYMGIDQYISSMGNETDDNFHPGVTFYETQLTSRSQGSLNWKMTAQTMEKRDNSNYLSINEIIEWVFYDNAKEYMSVTASSARVFTRNQDVDIDGPVEILLWLGEN